MSSIEYSSAPEFHREAVAPAARRLIDFRPGEYFENAVFAVSEKQQKTAKNGNLFLMLRLRDCTGERNARWFSPPADALERLNGACLVRVNGRVESQNPAFVGDFRLDACEPLETPDDLSPYLVPLPADHVAHIARFREVARSVKDRHLKALLKEIFHSDGELWPRFETAPAARKLHHAYRGGLLEHSGEVALLCERIASTLPHLDRDLLVAAALLHDIGKLEEMESDLAAGEYTAAGHLVGHVVLGTCTVAAAIEKIEGFPVALKHELMHLILSHHGRPEYGAAKIPMCAEAMVLSQCDLMSAKAAQCREQLSENGDCDDFTKIYGWDSGQVYLGSMRRMLDGAAEDASSD